MVGALVQCNYGTRDNLRIAGISRRPRNPCAGTISPFIPSDIAERGSFIVVVANRRSAAGAPAETSCAPG